MAKQEEEESAGQVQTTCALCGKALRWQARWGRGSCGQWCLYGLEMLDDLRKALVEGQRSLERTGDHLGDRDLEDEPSAQDNAWHSEAERQCKHLAGVAYAGLRKLDGLGYSGRSGVGGDPTAVGRRSESEEDSGER